MVIFGWCCLCRCSGETVDHFLLHCPMSCQIWSFVFKLFGVDWVMSGCVLDQLACWRNWFGKHSSEVWNLAPSCVMWSLWRERNNRTFENIEHSVGQLIEFCMVSLFDWARDWGLTTSTSIGGFLESLRYPNAL